MADARGGVSCRGLGDLPQDCIASILSRTSPKDVARLACVSSVYRDASNADSVWQMMLPPWYADVLAQAPDGAPTSTSSKKQAFTYLCNRVLLENDTQVWFISISLLFSQCCEAEQLFYKVEALHCAFDARD